MLYTKLYMFNFLRRDTEIFSCIFRFDKPDQIEREIKHNLSFALIIKV